jgi:hypothetical protein
MSYKSLNSNIPAIVYYCESDYSSSSSGFTVIKVESSAANSITPMELVKQYMLDEIRAIRETRHMLKNKYPELFSLYAI